MIAAPAPSTITLGLLAGGRATRLGGVDKAWLVRDGVSQVERWHTRFANETAAMLVSANRDLPRYAALGLVAVPDRIAGDIGPMAGLDALAAAAETPWLLTIPVDLVGVNECLLPTLAAAAKGKGACAVDDDGLQPLVALWSVVDLREGVRAAISRDERAVHVLQASLGMAAVRLEGVRFGNLNTPDDLAAAGIDVAHGLPTT